MKHDAKELTIVPWPNVSGDGLVHGMLLLFVFYGLWRMAPSTGARADAAGTALNLVLVFGFGYLFFRIFRGLTDRDYADQVVTVSQGRITWARKTKWWTRERRLKAG